MAEPAFGDIWSAVTHVISLHKFHQQSIMQHTDYT